MRLSLNFRNEDGGLLKNMNQRQSLVEQDDDLENWDQIEDKYQEMLEEQDQNEYKNVIN